jgi:hypothetical protein
VNTRFPRRPIDVAVLTCPEFLFDDVHNRTDKHRLICEDAVKAKAGMSLPELPMLLLAIVPLCAVAVYLITSGVRMPSRVIPTPLGWMSEEWLADYRVSHAS